MTINLEGFQGLVPKKDPTLLPPMAAQKAVNCKLWSGAIDPYYGPLPVFTPTKTGTMQSMYRMDDRAGGSDYWLTWPFDIDAARGLVVDSYQRLYYTGQYEPRVTNYEMAALGVDTVNGSDNYPGGFGESGTDYPLAFYALGAPNPLTAPVVAVSGGVAADVTRAYEYTFVTPWGEESGPSPATVLAGKPDGTWNLSQMDAAPTNSGSIIGGTASGATVTLYTQNMNWCRAGHRITVASVTGLTDANGAWTLTGALNKSYTTVSRSILSNVATVVLKSVEGLVAGQVVTMAGLGGAAAYLGTKTLISVNATTKAITYAATATDEGVTADTAGSCKMGYIQVAKTSVQSYTSGGTWTREAPWNSANGRKRIYRTLTGSSATSFQLVTEVPASSTTYADTTTDPNLGPVIATVGYDTPDGTMTCLTDMPNGMMAGAISNAVAFAAVFKPYAWPIEYQQPVNWPVVGLGVFGQSLAVMTSGAHYVMSGVSPESVSAIAHVDAYPCKSKRGIQSMGFGVTYPSDLGQVLVGASGAQLLTQEYYSRDEWRSAVNGGNFEASMVYDNRYYAFWMGADDVQAGLIIDPLDNAAVITQSTVIVKGAWTDPESGLAYILDELDRVAQWDADVARRLPMQWKSKLFNPPKPINYAMASVDAVFNINADEIAAIEAENAARVAANVALLATVPTGIHTLDPTGGSIGSWALGSSALAKTNLYAPLSTSPEYVQFDVIADGITRFSKTLRASATFRLTGGFRSDQYEINIVANVRVRSAIVGMGPKDLARS
jgi:hypothetical protein